MKPPVLPSVVIDDTCVGPLLVAASDLGIAGVWFIGDSKRETARAQLSAQLAVPVVADDSPHLQRARRQLLGYFAGRRRAFTVPLDLDVCGTSFQQRVWRALTRVPYAETLSYGEVARNMGRPQSARAVAQACAHNPLPIVVPCHRIVASDGTLGGYAGGVQRKRQLLSLERHQVTHLPLFDVADRREATEDRHHDQDRVLALLPATLREPLEHPLDAPHIDTERWLLAAIHHIEPSDLPVLADLVVERAVASDSEALKVVGNELLGTAAARLIDQLPSPAHAVQLLRAALRLDSANYEIIARRLAASPRLPTAVRREIDGFFRTVMAADVDASARRRELTVDLWRELQQRGGDAAWASDLAADPSAVLAANGSHMEAALAAELELASGSDDPRALRERLVDLYERQGDWEMARVHLFALVAERPSPRDVQRLRVLEDHSRAAHDGDER